MKKRALLLVATALLLMCLAIPASAENAQYATTELFLEYLDEEGYYYTYKGIDGDGYERLEMAFEGDAFEPDVQLYFTENEDRCSLRVWDVIEYDEPMQPVILGVVNSLNSQYMFAKWTAEEECSVTLAMDVLLRPSDDMSEILIDAVKRTASIADSGYPELAPYAKAD